MLRFHSSIAVSMTVLLGASAFGASGGRDLYIAKCYACHALDGSGNSTIGRSLKLSDVRPAIKSMTDEQLRQIIYEGKGKMPPFKKIDDQKIRSLILFLRDLAAGNPDTGRSALEAQAEPLPNVQEVFRDKCSACHAQDGTGRTSIGKSLKICDLTSAAVQNQSADELAGVISKGRGKMPAYAKTFNPVQVVQLVSYIHALTKVASAGEPVDNTRPSMSTPQPNPPSPPTSAQPKSEARSPNSTRSTALLKLPTVEERKTPEPKPTSAPAATKGPNGGREIYIAKCSACHSRDGSGTGTIGRSMRIPSLTSPPVQEQSDQALASVISNGVGKMPAYKKKYNSEQIQLLVVYIRELGKKP